MSTTTETQHSFLGPVAAWFGGWHFPTVAITFVLSFALLTLLVTFAPASPTGFGAFAETFRVWCFGAEDNASLVPAFFMCSELVVFALIVWFIWSSPLRRALRNQRRRIVGTAAISFVAVIAAMVALVGLSTPDVRAFTLSGIRTAVPAPKLALVDQDKEPFNIIDFRGKVVAVTAVYSTCGNTCPMLLGAARKAIASLTDAERADLRIIAITLDPAHDTPDNLATIAFHQGAEKPLWRLASGATAAVEATLDRWNVSRTRDPETGQIDHSNAFMLIDRAGRLSFRLGLPDAEGDRFAEALRLLLAESPGVVP